MVDGITSTIHLFTRPQWDKQWIAAVLIFFFMLKSDLIFKNCLDEADSFFMHYYQIVNKISILSSRLSSLPLICTHFRTLLTVTKGRPLELVHTKSISFSFLRRCFTLKKNAKASSKGFFSTIQELFLQETLFFESN